MKFFLSYLRSHRKTLLFFLLLFALLCFSFLLYHLPPEAVVYPMLLGVLLGLGFLLADYLSVRKTHRVLLSLQSLGAELADSLPVPRSIPSEDYQALIRLLTEQRTRLADASAERYDSMISYYTVWAHQIKTPIASMRLTLQNEDTSLSRRLQLDLGRIEQYVEMVLAFLRLDSDSTDYVIRECDLDGIVRPAVRRFAGEFIDKKLTVACEPLNRRVLTDEKWLSFVVEQLLSNALKYTFSGGITVEMEGENTLCVRDTGIGIAPEDLPRIFENGFTGFNGRADLRASGIGLYLCRRVCDRLGHGLSAESVPGEGSVFRITFGARKLGVE